MSVSSSDVASSDSKNTSIASAPPLPLPLPLPPLLGSEAFSGPRQAIVLACQQAWEAGEGAGLLWPLLAASHAPPPDVQCRHPSGCKAPWVAHLSSASVLCNLHQIMSFDPLEHVAPWSAPGGAWIWIWILREALIKVISKPTSR